MTFRSFLILLCGSTLAGPVMAQSKLDAPATPTAPGSAMYTLADLYNRLVDGTAGTVRAGGFTEPAAGPTAAGTMYTLDQIMGRMPTVDANGATEAEVLSGKTFWGLTSGAWGVKTGTAIIATGDAEIGDVLTGKTFSNSTGTGLTGTRAPAPVPKTGQTAVYATGDDGDLQKGIAWPVQRFKDNNNGTVTDNLTGLIWLKKANCFFVYSWDDALSAVNELASGDCDLNDGSVAGDWRLPSLKELQSLIDYGKHDPALPDGHPFTDVQTFYYWSSTTYAPSTGYAWEVYLRDGYVGGSGKTDFPRYVWPVRGGQ